MFGSRTGGDLHLGKHVINVGLGKLLSVHTCQHAAKMLPTQVETSPKKVLEKCPVDDPSTSRRIRLKTTEMMKLTELKMPSKKATPAVGMNEKYK